MKKSPFCLLPSLLLVSCESPAPVIISNPAPQPSYSAPASSTPAPVVSAPVAPAYPPIAGVWRTAHATITVGPTSGNSFPITFMNHGMPKPHATTGRWGPLGRHFHFSSRKGSEVVATLNSQTAPTVITTDDKESGNNNHTWRR